ncbi:ABC transporter substrate-binding protein [Clostridium ganghwense]|uniref:ABC transporter substrate-binding protein n=1 Tax=Clostridium ganghwense TaxID=312089 RepID=A0ABT4CX69_9CLOT|nr:ABC transporter substrate-binding protein [Clostridium ganghwense]MCY6372776.1 ABC transporter substrate-binding protein [Clostridium ganghwense]
MRIKKLLYIFLVSLVMVFFTSCGDSKTKVIYKKDGYPDLKGRNLVVYVASREDVGKLLLEMFKEKTGCTYEYMRMPTEEAVARVRVEKDYPKADIFMGGTCDAHTVMKDEQLSEQYKSENAKNILEPYKDKDGYWTGFELEPLSIAINKERWEKEFKPRGIKVPTEYEDLLNPIYKGEIVMPDPKTSGTAYTIVASLVQSMGTDKAIEYLKGLKSNVGQFTVNGYTPCQKVGTGEYLIGINFLGDQLMMKKSGFDMITNVPKNAGWTIDAISKIKKGPNEDIANLFIDFCLSEEGANALKNISMGFPTREDIDMSYKAKTLSDLEIYKEYDFYKAGKEKEFLVDMWEKIN